MSLNHDHHEARALARLQWARQALGDGEALLQRASVDAGHRMGRFFAQNVEAPLVEAGVADDGVVPEAFGRTQ